MEENIPNINENRAAGFRRRVLVSVLTAPAPILFMIAVRLSLFYYSREYYIAELFESLFYVLALWALVLIILPMLVLLGYYYALVKAKDQISNYDTLLTKVLSVMSACNVFFRMINLIVLIVLLFSLSSDFGFYQFMAIGCLVFSMHVFDKLDRHL